MVEVLADSQCWRSNYIHVHFQQFCDYGKARRSRTAGTLRQAPWLQFGQHGYSWVATHRNRWNAISDQETSCRSPRREEAGCWLCGAPKVKPAIERHPAMLRQNHTDGCCSWHNRTVKYPQTRPRRNGTGASPPGWCRQPTPEPMPSLPDMPPLTRMPPAPPGYNAGAQRSQIIILPAVYIYSHKYLLWAECFTLDAYAQDSQHDTDLTQICRLMKEHPLVSTLSAGW